MLPIRIPLTLLLLACTCLPAVGWARGTIEKVTIRGLDKGNEAEMIENIEVSLSVYDVIGKVQGESRLEYLLAQAERQTRQALEPFGYYNPTINVEAPRTGDSLTVVITVAKGAPVTVRRSNVTIQGPGGSDRYLQQDLEKFQPRQGQAFDHSSYEASKITITRRLAERGYFDSDFTQRQVAVTRAENAADIDLGWDSGMRYNVGAIRFHDDYFRPGLFDPLVYWEQGSYWHEGKLDRLRESLNKLDYFSTIDIQPRPEEGWVTGEVPVDITLTRAKRNIYTAGVSFGSESGAGVRGGVERRYVNRRGHKLNTQVDYAQKRKSLLTSYRIPAFRWLDGWYAVTATGYDEQTDYIDLRTYKLIGSRSGEVSENLTLVASINAMRERWRYSSGDGPDYDGAQYQSATLFYPQLVADYVNVDDRLFPRRGYSGSATVRGGLSGAGSDASFTQLHLQARAYFPVGRNNRLITRAEAGTTWTSDLVAIAPSLRYFAGGDRSIRGYAFREVGPRTPAPDRFALGAKNVVVASAEYEHYFGDSPWGAAVFVDTGSAYDDKVELKTGVGLGLRWKSPVGPVRVDIAHGLDEPDSQFQLYLNIGADL